ncbi:MAG: sulfatase [Candidatus Brocadiia bacterium]
MNRRAFLGLMGAAAALPRTLLGQRGQERPPNFVVIFTDDQGYQDLGCFGSPDIATPRIDEMCAQGMKFADFYASAPVCTPSRASLLTGCYAQRVSLPGVLFPRSNVGLNPSEVTIAEVLKARGYATACIGKWHLGHHKKFLPTRHGFDRYLGIPYSNDMWLAAGMDFAEDAKLPEGASVEKLKDGEKKRNQVPLVRDEEVIEYPVDQSTLTQRYTQEAIDFISANRDRPFFLYLPHTMPHVPLYCSEDFRGKSKRGLYGDVIQEIDWSTGQILDALKKLGLDEHTCVIYTSDNGPWLGKGKNGGSAKPLRAGKFSTYEGGMREPCVMRWPGRIPAGQTCREVATTLDLLPTLAKLAGARVPDDRTIDGKDIWPLMAGAPGAKSPHQAFCYFRGNRLAAVRAGKWKLHLARGKGKQAKVELYDLEEDIGESNNVADQHPQVVQRLQGLAQEREKDVRENRRPPGKA